MIDHEGIKILFISKIIAISISIISFNQSIISLDSNIIIYLIIINPDNTKYHEIIDMEINEKYRYNDINKDIKFSKINSYNIKSELPHHQSNTQIQSISNTPDI
jgi:hypothetical protein